MISEILPLLYSERECQRHSIIFQPVTLVKQSRIRW